MPEIISRWPTAQGSSVSVYKDTEHQKVGCLFLQKVENRWLFVGYSEAKKDFMENKGLAGNSQSLVFKWYAREESNLRPTEPESVTLSS